ncbi:MAG: hypothetical protein R3C11_00235 [Planctomycetaceae bacterium]
MNDGNGNFTDTGIRIGSSSTLGVGIGDLDGDGDLDLVSANFTQNNQVWLNDNISLPFTQDFEGGNSKGLVMNDPATFSVIDSGGNKKLQSDNSGLTGLSAALLALPTIPLAHSLSAEMTSLSGANRWLDGFLIFDYKNDNDFKYAGYFTGQNQWVIGHYQGNFSNLLAMIDWDDTGRSINANQAYELRRSLRLYRKVIRR